MMRRRSLALLAASALLLAPLSACAALPGSSAPGGAPGNATLDATPLPGDLGGSGERLTGEAMNADAGAERSLTRSAELALTADDVRGTADRAAKIAEGAGGRVDSRTEDAGTGAGSGSSSLSLRVPAERLDATLTELAALGTVERQSVSAVDVTAEHVDLTARVEALESSIARLTQLMADASTTSELLEAESALSSRQQELDGLRAQLTWLEGQVDEATIWVSVSAPTVLPGGGPASFWDGVLAGLQSIGAAASGGLVLLGILLPWLVIGAVIAGAVLLLVRAARRRRADAARRQSEEGPVPEATPETR